MRNFPSPQPWVRCSFAPDPLLDLGSSIERALDEVVTNICHLRAATTSSLDLWPCQKHSVHRMRIRKKQFLPTPSCFSASLPSARLVPHAGRSSFAAKRLSTKTGKSQLFLLAAGFFRSAVYESDSAINVTIFN